MNRTRKMNPAAPTTQNTSGSASAKEKVNAYRTGYQDAVNVTATMTTDRSGRRALDELRGGDAKPYRLLAARRNPLG